MQTIEDIIEPTEAVFWEGGPAKVFSITALEGGTEADMSQEFGFTPVNRLVGILAFTVVLGGFSYMHGFYLGIAISLFGGLGMLLIPEYLQKRRQQETKYWITSKRLIFRLWWHGKVSFHTIDLNQISRLLVASASGGTGTIYFICKDHSILDFNTHDFKEGRIRQQPTFELIEEVDVVEKILRQKIRESNNNLNFKG